MPDQMGEVDVALEQGLGLAIPSGHVDREMRVGLLRFLGVPVAPVPTKRRDTADCIVVETVYPRRAASSWTHFSVPSIRLRLIPPDFPVHSSVQ